ncbi:MAG: WD40 repeat domain-containing protein [Pirellulales bacterium]
MFALIVSACARAVVPGAAVAQQTTTVEPSQIIEYEPRLPEDRPPVITAVALVAGGGMVATAGDDHVVRLWNTTSGQLTQTLEGHRDWVRTLAFSPDGRTLASAGDDRQIILWDAETGKLRSRFAAHRYAVYSIAFSPDGAQLAAVGFEHLVRVYDVATGQLARTLEGPGVDLRTVVFSPAGSHLATAGRNGQIRVWRLADSTISLEIAASPTRIRTLAYVPQGNLLVAAGDSRAITFWDATSGEQRGTLNPRSGKLLSMAVCGENVVATGGSDNVVRVWNWRTQQESDRLLGHTGSVATLAYDPTSDMIISGSFDTTVRVWKLAGTAAAASSADAQPADGPVRQ